MIGESIIKKDKGLEPYIFLVVAAIGIGTAIRLIHDIRLASKRHELTELQIEAMKRQQGIR